MIRPERMHLRVERADDRVASVPAEVVDLVFQGPVVRFDARARPTAASSSRTSVPTTSCRCCARATGVGRAGSRTAGRLLRRSDRVASTRADEIEELQPVSTRSDA